MPHSTMNGGAVNFDELSAIILDDLKIKMQLRHMLTINEI
jgi:hypothetical protein